jgi:hypothetical protein
VLPQTTSDVSAAVVALQKSEGGQRSLFAVRSGGHTAWAGAANIENGVVIDLRNLNSVELSANQSTVSVGVGASWDMVYALLDPLGLSVNGGRAAGVGESCRQNQQCLYVLPLLIMTRRRWPLPRRRHLILLTPIRLDLRHRNQLPNRPSRRGHC